MERWGAFSVIDHTDPYRLAIDLLLYDKICVPTPMDGMGGQDWERWYNEGWQPDVLMRIIEKLRVFGLVEEAEWDLDRQLNWREKFEEAKAAIERVGEEVSATAEATVNQTPGAASMTPLERERAIRRVALQITRDEVIRHLKGRKENGTVSIWHGPVEFYSAYQSRRDFETYHPTEDAVKNGVERANLLIKHRLAIPSTSPDKLLDEVIKTVTDTKFKEKRMDFYEWQLELVERRHSPESIVVDLEKRVSAFNETVVRASDSKNRWETAVLVLSVAAATMGAIGTYQTPDILHGGATMIAGSQVGVGFFRRSGFGKGADGTQKIAIPGAMFHQIDVDTGFEFTASKK